MASLTEVQYWDADWHGVRLPIKVHYRWKFESHSIHKYLARVVPPAGGSILEVGCGGSGFLPHFRNAFDLDVYGLDYSPVGVELAKENLRLQGAEGTVWQGDLFAPPPEVGEYDAVFSWGFVEHFDDIPEVMRALARFAKPGGRVITAVPNFSGWLRHLQKHLDPKDYGAHNPIRRAELDRAIEDAGLVVEHATAPIGFFNARACGFPAVISRLPPKGQRALDAARGLVNRIVNAPATVLDWAPEHDLVSAHVIGTAVRPR